MVSRRVGRVAVLATAGLLISASLSITAGLAGSQYVSGIELVDLNVRQAQPADEQQATAWNHAYTFMLDNPTHISYPWIDPTSGVLELSVTGEEGLAQLNVLEPLLVGAPHQSRTVTRSYAQLEELTTALTELKTLALPGSELMFRIEPDEEANRLIVVMNEQHDGFISELAARFGIESIAVRIDPTASGATPDTHIRSSDASPFYGGAKTTNCSDAFAWNNGSLWEGMLTAAHCIPDGGNVSTPADLIGNVQAGCRENWKPGNGNGTVPYCGETINRGDVALIQLATGKDAVARMFRGGPDASTNSPVRVVWARWSRAGDTYCISARSGEICGFVVDAAGVSVWYTDGTWARNVTDGHKDAGTCPVPGDSGGAIFTIYNDGVAAKGVHSGGGSFPWACDEYFTDIQHPVQALPGGVSSIP